MPRKSTAADVGLMDVASWAFDSAVVFKLCVAVNLLSAVAQPIADCDETYNYWEPLHYIIYGRGFQTWEYAPEYALRSYAFLWLNGVVAWPLAHLFGLPSTLVFYAVRCWQALLCAGAQTYFYSAIARSNRRRIANACLLAMLASAGCFSASTAFLPSTFAMYATYVQLGAWIDRRYGLAVAAVAFSAIWVWPFAAALGIPLAVEIVLTHRWRQFIGYSLALGLACLAVLLPIDAYYYGRMVVAPVNIVWYNIFTTHGPDLYGTESWTFYAANYFLAFNAMTTLVALTPLLWLLQACLTKRSVRATIIDPHTPLLWATSPFLVWNVVFGVQPHKEERFLYPAYPCMVLLIAIAVNTLETTIEAALALLRGSNNGGGGKGVVKARRFTDDLPSLAHVASLALYATYGALSLARIGAVVAGYRAPLFVYAQLGGAPELQLLAPGNSTAVLCVGKEWHRFPGSFFLPRRWRLEFIESEFRGQLPAHFRPASEHGSRQTGGRFNDLNQLDASRFVPLANCTHLVDLDTVARPSFSSASVEPHFSRFPEWRVRVEARFLDRVASHGVWKSFYVPGLFESRNVFANYVLLQRVL